MLDKQCDACGVHENVQIETVTNVAPKRDEMFPVMLCDKCKGLLSKSELDIQLNEKGNLVFIKKNKKP